jgi:hypothetical protein
MRKRTKKQRTDGYRGRWTVTGVNRLTGERESITIPCQYEQANAIYEKTKAKRASQRSYIRVKLERAGGGGSYRYSVRTIQMTWL